MADVGIGALGYVGYGVESGAAEGTAVAPTKFLAVNSISFSDSNDYLTPMQIRGNRDMSVAMPAPYQVTGTMEMAMVPDDIGYLLKSAFAASVVTSPYASGGYTHVFTPGNASPTFTFQTAAQDQLVMRYTGVRINTFELKAAFGEIVTASFGLDGVDRAKYTGSAPTVTYAANSTTPFHFNTSTVKIGTTIAGATADLNIRDYTFNINNNVEHIGTLRATRGYRRVALGARNVGLSMSVDLQGTTEYDRLLNDTEFAVSLYMEGGRLVQQNVPTSLKIDLPRVKYRTVGVPINAGDYLTQDIECTVLKPTSGDIATVTLVSSDVSFPAVA